MNVFIAALGAIQLWLLWIAYSAFAGLSCVKLLICGPLIVSGFTVGLMCAQCLGSFLVRRAVRHYIRQRT